jgi:hypothetical protein
MTTQTKATLTIRIHDRDRGTTYIAKSATDCPPGPEREAFTIAQNHGSSIGMGVVVAEVLRYL